MKCITLEYPDGSVETRGGFLPQMLARALAAIRAEKPIQEVPWPSQSMAVVLLTKATSEDLDAARDAALAYVLEHRVPDDNPGAVARLEDVQFPPDKTFREAWRRRRAGVIEEDMTACRAIWKSEIRRARNAKLDALDPQTKSLQRRVERGRAEKSDLDAHEAEKDLLRDLPNGPEGTDARCDAAQTPTELKAVWPDELS